MANNKKYEPKRYTFEEALKLQEKLPKPELTVEELILLLLGLANKPINGRTVMQKEIFLLYQEIKDKVKVVDPEYVPYKYGPFSFKVARILEIMEMKNLLRVSNRRSKLRTKYELTPEGKELANKLLSYLSKKLGRDMIEYLTRKRIGWDQLGHHGILRYVYQNYSKWIDKSEIKDKYIHIDWGVSEA